jgi:hypothetical protein
MSTLSGTASDLSGSGEFGSVFSENLNVAKVFPPFKGGRFLRATDLGFAALWA